MERYKKYFGTYKVPFLAAIFCVSMEAICDLLGPTLMSKMINQGIVEASLPNVYRLGGWMLLVTVVGACFAISRNVLSSRVSQRLGADLRVDLFEKIMHFSETSADQMESGSLITRMTNDTAQIIQFINGMMRIFLKAPITCVGSIVLASMLNIRLSLIIYVLVLIVTGIIWISMHLSYPRFSSLQKAIDQVNQVVQEYLIGVRLVKAFGTYPEEMNKFEQANETLKTKGISAQMVITMLSPLITLTIGIGTIAVIFVGSRLYPMNLASPGDISAFIIYMAQILTSLVMITNVFNTFIRTKASTERINEVLACEEEVANGEDVELPRGALTFEGVTFAYPGGSGIPAIKDLSFSVHPGESLAIIGSTGSGKSTIAWLLCRFYAPDKGRICIDGKDLQSLSLSSVRRAVAIVPQKPMLFSGSISNNIRFGNKQATKEEVIQAADMAQADFISQMPNQYDSMLGGGGVNVSGGQKQRISIARGILKAASILILDDATSALDAVTDAKVRERLRNRTKQQTVITITQRCGTAMDADRILVLDNGRKAGFGTHEELMKHCDIYAEIYQTQMESSKEA